MLGEARALHDACDEKSFAWHEQEIERIKREAGNTTQSLQDNWKLNIRKAAESRVDLTVTLDQRAMRALQKNEKLAREKSRGSNTNTPAKKIVFQQAADVRKRELEKGRAEKEKQLAVKYSDRWQALETEWKTKTLAIYAEIPPRRPLRQNFFRIGSR